MEYARALVEHLIFAIFNVSLIVMQSYKNQLAVIVCAIKHTTFLKFNVAFICVI